MQKKKKKKKKKERKENRPTDPNFKFSHLRAIQHMFLASGTVLQASITKTEGNRVPDSCNCIHIHTFWSEFDRPIKGQTHRNPDFLHFRWSIVVLILPCICHGGKWTNKDKIWHFSQLRLKKSTYRNNYSIHNMKWSFNLSILPFCTVWVTFAWKSST